MRKNHSQRSEGLVPDPTYFDRSGNFSFYLDRLRVFSVKYRKSSTKEYKFKLPLFNRIYCVKTWLRKVISLPLVLIGINVITIIQEL